MSNYDELRASFEKWAERETNWNLAKLSNGDYQPMSAASFAFEGYLAHAAIAAAPQPDTQTQAPEGGEPVAVFEHIRLSPSMRETRIVEDEKLQSLPVGRYALYLHTPAAVEQSDEADRRTKDA